eukprot:13649.XXX_475682_475017_1 [CDS] Oithona nana genome sequencing.
MRSHKASPSRSLSMGRSSKPSLQYVFLLLIVVATTTQAFLLGYQDRFPIASRFEKLNQRLRRYDSFDNPREIQETRQPSFWSQLFKRHDLVGPHPEGNEELLNNNLFRLRKRSRG